jgi:N-acetylglutamate synthase-like GNAT family acetyltransferase
MLSLPGGMEVSFRTIRPDDVDALQRFHSRLGERTIYLRFFGSMKELSERKATYCASVDGIDNVAFVALDPEAAEYAALVEDRWQDQGIGIALTRELIGEARDKGVRRFYALVMGENRRML